MDRKEEYRKRIIEACDERCMIAPSDCGCYQLWIDCGYLTSEGLRIIADELDRRNKPYLDQIEKDFGSLVGE